MFQSRIEEGLADDAVGFSVEDEELIEDARRFSIRAGVDLKMTLRLGMEMRRCEVVAGESLDGLKDEAEL